MSIAVLSKASSPEACWPDTGFVYSFPSGLISWVLPQMLQQLALIFFNKCSLIKPVSWNSSINTTISNSPYILITLHEHGGHYYTWVSKQSTTTEFELCYMWSDWPKACQASQWHWRSPIQCFTTPVPKPAVRAVSIIPLHQEASTIRVPTGIFKINIT